VLPFGGTQFKEIIERQELRRQRLFIQ
jgi:hypothetical protein